MFFNILKIVRTRSHRKPGRMLLAECSVMLECTFVSAGGSTDFDLNALASSSVFFLRVERQRLVRSLQGGTVSLAPALVRSDPAGFHQTREEEAIFLRIALVLDAFQGI